MPGCIGHGVHPVPYPVHNSSQYQMLQGRYKYTMQREVEELVPLHWALSWVLRPREALNPTDCMWLALLPRMYSPWLRQLWIPSMNTGFFFIFFFFEPCWKLAIDDVTWQWFLQSTCLLQGKKYSPFLILQCHQTSPCSLLWKPRRSLTNMQTFTYPFFLATCKLCWSQIFKELVLCTRILPGTSLFPSPSAQPPLFWESLASPARIFCSWGSSTENMGLIRTPSH